RGRDAVYGPGCLFRRGGGQRPRVPGRGQPGGASVSRPQTITEKILARAAGVDRVEPGEIVMCDVDLAMGNDITAPVSIARFRELGVSRVWDPAKVALVPSHFMPAKDIASAKLGMTMREFAHQ